MSVKSLLKNFLLLFVLLFQVPVYAESYPQGNFVLAGGRYRATDDSDPFEKIDSIFFSSIIIPVKDSEIKFSTTKPVDLESGSQKFKGTISFSLDGNYDKETGAIAGRFTQNTVTSYDRKSSAGMRTGEGEASFTGKVTGTIIDNQVVLSFEGTLSGRSSSEADDKTIDTYTNPGTPWSKKVAFGTSEWIVQQEVEEQPAEESGRDSGARLSNISGQVEIACPPDLEAWDVMKMGRVIYVDCHLKTGEDSTAEVSFSDMTTLKMKPETELVINTPPQKDSKLKLLAGNIWVNVKKMIKDGTMEVHGSQAVAGIKGTTFELEETGGVTTLKVTEGTVAYKSLSSGEEKMVTGGETITASYGGLGEIEKFSESKQLPAKANYLPAITAFIVVFFIIGVVLVVKKLKSKG